MTDTPAPAFLWTVFTQLRRRHFPLSPADYDALRQALRAGFGWESRETLRDLCGALWAKSPDEQEIVATLFDQFQAESWTLPELTAASAPISPDQTAETQNQQPHAADTQPQVVTQETKGGLPPISLAGVEFPDFHFVLVPQLPLAYRDIAQTWRRMRQPVRQGPKEELDLDATIKQRCQQGVVSEVVLRPRRRNRARLLLLADCQGSMTPFQPFVAEVVAAIQQSGKLERAAAYYFHDVPVEGTDQAVLAPLADQLYPALDAVLADIAPAVEGLVFDTPDLLTPHALPEILKDHAQNATVVLLSDAGAAKRRYDIYRLLDTVAFCKALKSYTTRYVWLNPLPKKYWEHTTAAQIARHVPMLPLDLAGMHQAVNILRGQPYFVERPI